MKSSNYLIILKIFFITICLLILFVLLIKKEKQISSKSNLIIIDSSISFLLDKKWIKDSSYPVFGDMYLDYTSRYIFCDKKTVLTIKANNVKIRQILDFNEREIKERFKSNDFKQIEQGNFNVIKNKNTSFYLLDYKLNYLEDHFVGVFVCFIDSKKRFIEMDINSSKLTQERVNELTKQVILSFDIN